MDVKILPIKETSFSKEQILTLIKIAFQERKEAGLNYGCLSLSIEDFLKEIKDADVLVAIDRDKNVLCGCVVLLYRKDKEGLLYSKEKHTSVHPDYKGQGVGSLLIKAVKQAAIEHQCEYVICSTAVSAESAVNVHLKNGYRIIGLKSFKSTNYYSYLFRMQLQPSPWEDEKYCRQQYRKSARKVRIAYKTNGSKTMLGRILTKMGIKW